jgi:hypothetical protein
MSAVNMKKVGEVKYKPVAESCGAFEPRKPADLLFDPQHDDFVWTANKKYKYESAKRLSFSQNVPLKNGISDEKSAKKYLGDALDGSFTALCGSVFFPGHDKDER